MAAFAAGGCAPAALFPLWPRTGQAARLLLVQGVKGGRGALRLLPGMVLHRPDGGFTPEAEAILRAGASLPMT